MNPHIDTILQASGTTRAIRWRKVSELAPSVNPDHAASEAAYRAAKARLADFDDNKPIDPEFPHITRKTMREACEAMRPDETKGVDEK